VATLLVERVREKSHYWTTGEGRTHAAVPVRQVGDVDLVYLFTRSKKVSFRQESQNEESSSRTSLLAFHAHSGSRLRPGAFFSLDVGQRDEERRKAAPAREGQKGDQREREEVSASSRAIREESGSGSRSPRRESGLALSGPPETEPFMQTSTETTASSVPLLNPCASPVAARLRWPARPTTLPRSALRGGNGRAGDARS